MTVATGVEYLFCRFPKYRWWRKAPPAFALLLGAVLAFIRWRNWGEEGAPIEALLFFPGLSTLAMVVGCYLGWRIWRHLWTPRLKK